MGKRAEPPLHWRDVGRADLIELFSTGLTPEQVGARYERSAEMVRLKARAWNLDPRALRARVTGLAAQHPDVAAQFVCVVDGAPLTREAKDLSPGSGARCRWRCPTCAHEWITSVANRTRRRSGCPRCAVRRGKELARARAPKTEPLSHVAPDLAAQFVRNVSRPDRDATTTPSGSHDRIQWRCTAGHEWETAARQRVKYANQCPTCLSGLWTSRHEFEVAALVEASTGLAVTVGARVPWPGTSKDELIDLYVEGADLLVDLDPTRWHGSPNAAARDARKLSRLAGERYVRVRPHPLGLLTVPAAESRQQVLLTEAAGRDPWLWATAVVGALHDFAPHLPTRVPSAAERSVALIQADVRWRRLRSGARRRSLLSEHPRVAAQFVAVVGRPELSAADLAPAGNDRVHWRCADCGHQWEARVANRTLLGTGCPPCSYRRGAARAAAPRTGQSFADRHPELVSAFVENLTHPARARST
ncbi:hypothetical protein DQ239_12480 [Blastococcus sp. TF02-09]|uniref:zinc-ribbon domain-containing protein n=1 Tax=Blastococcus sp. TF02-09 TaxID=2250576 RepID=UPI000DE94CAB|nr:zinc-ribbon domain-containing protein [Blastococcus sp. TF02-9]RBY76987.1 hypothetical protein DQ239_12480 [Blastococcus sp. TF02-9]